MKKIALSLGCLALGVAAFAVAPAQESAPAPQAAVSAQDAAVRDYQLRFVACMMEDAAAQMENPVGETNPLIAFVKSFESSHKAAAAIPVADLPEEFQAYIRESGEISSGFVKECHALLDEADEEITEDTQKELMAIQLETQTRMEQLEVKYPAAAAKIGKEALKEFTAEIAEELGLTEKAIAWAEEHKDELVGLTPGASRAAVLRYIASELMKAVDAK